MKNASAANRNTATPFISDVKSLRDRARRHIEQGAVSETYIGDVARAIEILQAVLATEMVCVLRYTSTPSPPRASRAKASRRNSPSTPRKSRNMRWRGRTHQPAWRQARFQSRRAGHPLGVGICHGADLVEMIKENLIAERIAVDHYRELIRYFGDNDPATRVDAGRHSGRRGRARQRHAWICSPRTARRNPSDAFSPHGKARHAIPALDGIGRARGRPICAEREHGTAKHGAVMQDALIDADASRNTRMQDSVSTAQREVT